MKSTYVELKITCKKCFRDFRFWTIKGFDGYNPKYPYKGNSLNPIHYACPYCDYMKRTTKVVALRFFEIDVNVFDQRVF